MTRKLFPLLRLIAQLSARCIAVFRTVLQCPLRYTYRDFYAPFSCQDLLRVHIVPPWSLHAVLRALAKPPYEPLAQASFHHLTVKTVFLVAVASGQRRSTLHALTLEPGHIRWESAGVRLIPRAGFLAKIQTTSSQKDLQIFLPSLSAHSSVMQDKLWCPVWALKWYVDRSSSLRTCTDLFISTVAPHSRVSSSSSSSLST